ncbi:hypothetical protein Tco_0196092 [Tanacetum coccineum]
MIVILIPTTRIQKDHPKNQIIGDINSSTQTRRMTKISEEHALVLIKRRSNCASLLGFEDHSSLKKFNKVYLNEHQLCVNKEVVYVLVEQSDGHRNLEWFYGELTFFLWLQVKQKDDGIFISQEHIRQSLRSGKDRMETIRQEVKIPQSNFPTQTLVADEAAFTGVDVVHGGATTTVSSIDAGQGNGNITKSPTMPHDSPLLGGHTPGSNKGKISLFLPHVEVHGMYGTEFGTLKKVGCQRHADTTADDLTLIETLMEIRKSAAKAKGKAKMDETESPRKMKQREHCSEEDLPMKLVELVNQRKKFFAQQRAEAKRNMSMTPAQQKEYMSNYIKNQEGGYSIKQLKLLSFEQVKEIFKTTMRKVQSFVPIRSELEVKYLIIDWEVYSEDTRMYWKIIRVGNHTKAYQIFAEMLKKFDRDDLVKLWDLVKERFSTTEPTDDKKKELWVELKRLFEPDNDDTLWKL